MLPWSIAARMAGTVPPAGRILTLSSMSYCFRNRCAAASVAEPAVVTPMDCPASSGTEVYFLFANSEKIGRSEQVAIMTRSAPRRSALATSLAPRAPNCSSPLSRAATCCVPPTWDRSTFRAWRLKKPFSRAIYSPPWTELACAKAPLTEIVAAGLLAAGVDAAAAAGADVGWDWAAGAVATAAEVGWDWVAGTVAAASRVAGTAAALVAAGLAAAVAAAGAAVAWGGMLAVGVAAPAVVVAAVGLATAVGALVAAGALVAGGGVGGADDVELQPVAATTSTAAIQCRG